MSKWIGACRADSNHPNVQPSGHAAHRNIRSEHRWFQVKEPVPLISAIGNAEKARVNKVSSLKSQVSCLKNFKSQVPRVQIGKRLGTIKKFEDLQVWEQARALVQEIYSITNKGQFAKDFGLRDQIRRASVSIMANVAEGYERDGSGEFIQFLSIAKGSAGEVRCHLYIARDQNYLSQETFDQLKTMATDVSKMLNGLITYLKKAKMKGNKFKSVTHET